MCDFVGGQVIVTRPRGDGPAAMAALRSLRSLADRYRVQFVRSLHDLLQKAPAAEGKYEVPPFLVELASVQPGAELSFVDELRGVYLDIALNDGKAIADLVMNRNQQLH